MPDVDGHALELSRLGVGAALGSVGLGVAPLTAAFLVRFVVLVGFSAAASPLAACRFVL